MYLALSAQCFNVKTYFDDVRVFSITNDPPVANANGPYSGDEGSPITLTGTGSYDPDGTIVSYEWDLDNDGLYETNGQIVQKTWMANGHYTVWLKVVDNNGAEDTSSADVNVLDHAPTASFTWTPATPNEGTAVSFTDTSTSSQDTIVSWSWNFGDGGTSTLQNPTHIYDDNSEYTVTLTVTDSDSSTSAKTVMITVSNIAPTVGTFAGATINEGSTYTVSGSFTDPGADTWTATVDYGDGNGAQPLTLSGKTFSLSHTYADNGVYTVIVKVFDDDEGVGMDTVTIKVNNVALRITSMTCPLDPVKVGTSVTFTVGWMDPGLMDTQTIVWYWGDGSSSIVNAGVGSGSSTTQHTYLSSGVYTVS